jgi:hypothetical protein
LDILLPSSEIYRKFCITVFEFIGNCFFKMFLSSKTSIQSLGSEYFLELGSFQAFLHILQILNKPDVLKRFKTSFKPRLKTKVTTYTLIFVKYLVVFFSNHAIRAFSVFFEGFIENYIRSLTSWENF